MNPLDIALAIPLLYFSINGFRKGFIKELSSLLAIIFGVYAAIYCNSYIYELLQSYQMNNRYLMLISIALTFVSVVLIIHFIGKLLDKLIKIIALGFLNRMAGLFFGLIKGSIIILLFTYCLNFIDKLFAIIPIEMKNASVLYAYATKSLWMVKDFWPLDIPATTSS